VKRQQRWCALIILLAVCSLTVRVATRYTCMEDASAPALTSVHSQMVQAPIRQRLIQTAAAWHPPVACISTLDTVDFYPRVSPAGPPMPSVLFDESLYNRPPPSSEIFS
jgi:hypothetical protein